MRTLIIIVTSIIFVSIACAGPLTTPPPPAPGPNPRALGLVPPVNPAYGTPPGVTVKPTPNRDLPTTFGGTFPRGYVAPGYSGSMVDQLPVR